MAHRNEFQPGLSRAWYNRGRSAGKNKRYRDMYHAWDSARKKPSIPGKRVTAQESFFQGWHDATARNPAGPRVKLNKWIRGAGLRFRRVAGRLVVDVKRLRPRPRGATRKGGRGR